MASKSHSKEKKTRRNITSPFKYYDPIQHSMSTDKNSKSKHFISSFLFLLGKGEEKQED